MRADLVVHAYPPASTGGTELYTRRLAQGLIARGHQVRVLTWEAAERSTVGEAVTLRAEPGDHAAGAPDLLHLAFALDATDNPVRDEYDNPRVAAALRTLWRQQPPDVVHVTHCGYLSSAPLAVAAELGIPSVVTLTDLWALCPEGMLLRHDGRLCDGPSDMGSCARCLAHMGPRGARYARLTTALPTWSLRAAAHLAHLPLLHGTRPGAWLAALRARSATVRARLLSARALLSPSHHQIDLFERNGYPAGCIRHAPHGIPTPEALRPSTPPTPTGAPLRVGYIGPLAPHKGAGLLLDAWALLGDTGGASLACYGPTPGERHAAYGRAQLDRIAALPTVRHCGPFDNAAIAGVLDDLDLLVVPSLCYENTPTVIYEALAHGTPVLGSDRGGVSELVTLYQGGWLFARGDADALARRLRALLADPAGVRGAATRILPVPAMDDHIAAVAALYAQETHEH